MTVHNIQGICSNGKLALSWILLGDCEAIAIQIARDSEFTDTLRVFILPKSRQCTLDTGNGYWYYRMGALWNGKIEWSGIPAAVFVNTTKDVIPLNNAFFKMTRTQPITSGMRFFTTSTSNSYAILEYSKYPEFPASSTKTRYYIDASKGYLDCEGLDPGTQFNPGIAYYIRIASTDKPRDLPTATIDTMSHWFEYSEKRPLPFIKPINSNGQVQKKMDEILFREVSESKTPMRFSSYSDHIRYVAAKAKNTGGKS